MGVADEVLEGSAKADGTVKSHLQSSQKRVRLQSADSPSPWCSRWPLFASAQEMQVVTHWNHLVEADLDPRQLMTAVALEHPVALRLAAPFVVVRASFFYTSLQMDEGLPCSIVTASLQQMSNHWPAEIDLGDRTGVI